MKIEMLPLPCPLCGEDASVNTCRTSDPEYIRLNSRDTGYGVNCISCGLNNRGAAIGYATEALAITAWNRRAVAERNVKALRAKVGRLVLEAEAHHAARLRSIEHAEHHCARAERLAEALDRLLPFAGHHESCGDHDAYNNAETPSCGCGLDGLLESVAGLLGHDQEVR